MPAALPYAAPHASAPAPKTPRRTPAQRCLNLLDSLARTGTAFARRLYALKTRPSHPPRTHAHNRTNHLLHRALLALRHLATLTARLTNDPNYRGEPARPTRPHTTTPPNPNTPSRTRPSRPTRPPKPRPFEQRFAGRSVGQIIDTIRRDLGQPARIAPFIDRQLTPAPTLPPTPPPTPPFVLTQTTCPGVQPRHPDIAPRLSPRATPPPRARPPPLAA